MNRHSQPNISASTPSPCNDECELDHNDICTGCYRSIAEIIDWGMASDEKQKQEILKRCAHRKSAAHSLKP
ncbi:DUF1289 domain-containing protein [Coraliomargarita sp. W4R53]